MSSTPVKVSIALPVYNGDNYLEEAIESILAQTFTDFELLLCDNASTDRTEEICRKFASKDKRVRYIRHKENIGSGPNFRFAYDHAVGEYFKWSAHDDTIAPGFLQACVDALDNHPEISLCYPRVKVIDADSNYVEDHDVITETRAECPVKRFGSLMLAKGHRCNEVFGLIRRSDLDQTEGMGSYAVADRVLLAQLALRGPFFEHPDRLFHNRRHAQQFSHTIKTQHQSTVWWDSTQKGKIFFPEWRAFDGYRRSLRDAPINFPQRCLGKLYLLQYLRRYRHRLMHDVKLGFKAWMGRFTGKQVVLEDREPEQ